MTAIFTSFEGDYHLGVVALLNSAIRSGFVGEFHVFHRSPDLPQWTTQLKNVEGNWFGIENVEVFFHLAIDERHFGYSKPFQANFVLCARPSVRKLFYFDPDVIVVSPWSFFELWVACGVAVVMDCNAPLVPEGHPWRCEWRALAGRTGIITRREGAGCEYANSGFFGVDRVNRGLLENWIRLTLQFEQECGDTRTFHLTERWRAVTGDQELLAAALDTWNGSVSFVGPDGMGFNGHYWLLSHATEQPKPWRRNCVIEAVVGNPPMRTVGFYLDNLYVPVRGRSALAIWIHKLSYRIARLVGRVWQRPNR